MSFEKNDNHVAAAVLKLAAPFWGKPRIASIVVAIGLQLQELENVFFDIRTSRLLANATGVRLAALGRLVGQYNPGLADDEYRLLIRARIRVNRSEGLLKDLREVLALLNAPATITKLGNANLRVELLQPTANAAIIADLLAETVAAGIGLHMSATTSSSNLLRFGSATDSTLGTAPGYVADASAPVASFVIRN